MPDLQAKCPSAQNLSLSKSMLHAFAEHALLGMHLMGQVLLWAVLPTALDSPEAVHGKPGAGSACLAREQSRPSDSP